MNRGLQSGLGPGEFPDPPGRCTRFATSASLAANATDSAATIQLFKGYRLYSICTSRPARVELYTTAAARAADASRATGTDPAGTAGVVLDYVTAAGWVTYTLSPIVEGANMETSPTDRISLSVTNLDSVTGTVVVTFVVARME